MLKKILLDETNRLIISEMLKDGRVKYTALAKKLGITPAAVKERVERLLKNKIIRASALLNTQQFYPVNATIGLEADSESINLLIRKLRPCPLVISMTRTSGVHNLIVNIVAEDFQQLESFLDNQIRNEPGIKHVEVNIGNNSTVVPEYTQMRLFYEDDTKFVPCGLRYDDKNVCLNCPGLMNVKKLREKKQMKKEG
jgi:DNA-binding Lrp family transcriptional regulator